MFEKFFLRLPTPQDQQSVYELMIRCDIRDVGFPDTDLEDLGHDWDEINLARDAWLAFDAKGVLHGYSAVLPWTEGVRMVIYDDPGTEDTDLFLGLMLMCEKRAVNIIQEMNNPAKRGIYTHLSDSAAIKDPFWKKLATGSRNIFLICTRTFPVNSLILNCRKVSAFAQPFQTRMSQPSML